MIFFAVIFGNTDCDFPVEHGSLLFVVVPDESLAQELIRRQIKQKQVPNVEC